MNILIIGGAGYIGSKLIKHLLDNKYKVTVFDRLLFGADHLCISRMMKISFLLWRY